MLVALDARLAPVPSVVSLRAPSSATQSRIPRRHQFTSHPHRTLLRLHLAMWCTRLMGRRCPDRDAIGRASPFMTPTATSSDGAAVRSPSVRRPLRTESVVVIKPGGGSPARLSFAGRNAEDPARAGL